MSARRGGREESPLAGILRRSAREAEVLRSEQPTEGPTEAHARVDQPVRERQPAGPRPGKRRRGRPRGGRRSNPDYVQISARIHKDVRFGLERALAERSEREGRVVEMAEVIENLMRFYIEKGDPWHATGH